MQKQDDMKWKNGENTFAYSLWWEVHGTCSIVSRWSLRTSSRGCLPAPRPAKSQGHKNIVETLCISLFNSISLSALCRQQHILQDSWLWYSKMQEYVRKSFWLVCHWHCAQSEQKYYAMYKNYWFPCHAETYHSISSSVQTLDKRLSHLLYPAEYLSIHTLHVCWYINYLNAIV